MTESSGCASSADEEWEWVCREVRIQRVALPQKSGLRVMERLLIDHKRRRSFRGLGRIDGYFYWARPCALEYIIQSGNAPIRTTGCPGYDSQSEKTGATSSSKASLMALKRSVDTTVEYLQKVNTTNDAGGTRRGIRDGALVAAKPNLEGGP